MAKSYVLEMAKLADTFEWTTNTGIRNLRQAVRAAAISPLVAVGSGGSLTAAHALVDLHRRSTGRIAAVATPLEVVAEPLEADIAMWLLSAGGTNVDILTAAKTLIAREYRQIAVLCGREQSRLAKLCRQHPFVDLLIYPPPAGKDGFLATNSLLAFTALLTRAYAAEFEDAVDWADVVEQLAPLLDGESDTVLTWERLTRSLWTRPTTLVLYGPSTRIGAIDLESKFTEAALGNLQVADYRNFAHGRHHWLAKRGEASAVLAFVSDNDRALAERTLELIPPEIPHARLEFGGSPSVAALAALIAALRIAGWAGSARGIAPGGPGVPEFGRKLYKLSLRKQGHTAGKRSLSARDACAIARKARMHPARLERRSDLTRWRTSLDSFRDRLRSTAFAAVVLDYDGTIVDTRSRFDPPGDAIVRQLIHAVEAGVQLAIATGRGASVRRDLRACLPQAIWSRVIVGYYNGAEVARLNNDAVPDGTAGTCEALTPLAAALRAQPELAEVADQTDRRYQITIEARRHMPENRLWDLTQQVLLLHRSADATITRSSHSIDIVAPAVSKLNVLAFLEDKIGKAPILTIGDRGCWPGNDYELLRGDYALSVDEISVDPTTCWNLAPCGQRGVTVTLDYLSALEPAGGALRFRSGALA